MVLRGDCAKRVDNRHRFVNDLPMLQIFREELLTLGIFGGSDN